MFCVKCGNKIDDSVVFCPNCGNKVGASFVDTEPIIKSKKECIYDGMCQYIKGMTTYHNASFGELENYEEGIEGKVYTEIIASYRNMFGQTKKTRFGAVIKEVESDGNCVFATPGPQEMMPLVTAKTLKRMLGFKSM